MKLKRLIQNAGLTQAKLAKKLNTYQQKIAYWINGGQPDFSYVPKLADCLNTTIDAIVFAIIEG